MQGEFVIVRCRDAGVHCGNLDSVHGRIVTLKNSRRIWRWSGANTLNELANSGAHASSRISEPVDKIVLLEACEIIPCTQKAQENLKKSRWN